MILFLTLTVIVIFILIFVLQKANSLQRRRNTTTTPDSMNQQQQAPAIIESDSEPVEPEAPQPFGFKCSWLAVKTTDAQQVIQKLNLRNVRQANWTSGLAAAYEMDGEVFVTPALGEWVLVIGQSLPTAGGEGHPDEITPMIQSLSSVFEEVQYFSTHRTVEYHAWAKVQNGETIRAYAYLGESGETIWDQGEMTEEEKELDIQTDFPDEEDVLQLAAKWSVDPAFEEQSYSPETGWIGKL